MLYEYAIIMWVVREPPSGKRPDLPPERGGLQYDGDRSTYIVAFDY